MNGAARLKNWLKTFLSGKALKKSSAGTAVVALVVLAFLVLALRRDWDTIRTYNWQLHWGDLLMMVLLHVAAQVSQFMPWHLLMARLTGQGEWRTNFRIFSVSMLARRIPVPIWYVGSRLLLYKVEQTSGLLVLTATAIETVLIAIAGLLCYVLLLPWYSYAQQWPWWLLALGAGILPLILFLRPGLLVDLTNKVLVWLKRSPVPSEISRRDLLTWGLYYLATWFIDGLGLYFCVAAFLPTAPSVSNIIGVSTVAALVALATMALPSGFGLKEITMGALLGAWVPVAAGVVISVIYRILQTLAEMGIAFAAQKIAKDVLVTPETDN